MPESPPKWNQSTQINIFLTLLTFRIQSYAWLANLDFSGALYHVMAPGNGGNAVFVTDDNRKVFLH